MDEPAPLLSLASVAQTARFTEFTVSVRTASLLSAASLILWCQPASAQDQSSPDEAARAPMSDDIATSPENNPEQTIAFNAGQLDYDSEADIVTASDDVFLAREGYRLRADEVRWDRKSGDIVASGNVAITSPGGDTAYGTRIVLTDSLRDGMVENLLVVFERGGRVAAMSGQRFANGDMVLERAAYTGCPVVDADGCPKEPSWQIKAQRVTYDKSRDRLRYEGARVELFGLPLVPLPFLSHGVGTEGKSGLLVPSIGIDRVNGAELSVPYYFRLAPNRDATITPYLYSDANPMIGAEYRALTSLGAYRARGYLTYGKRIPITGVAADSERDIRGYAEASGRFQLDPAWSVSGSLRATTDRTFLRRYDISRDDRLRSTIDVERVTASSYFSIAGWAVQTLRLGDVQGQQPIALPIVDYRKRLADPLLGGLIELQANSLGILRTDGQDSQRAFASAQWNLRRLTTLGQLVTITGLIRGDVYHSDENALTTVVDYRGEPGWQARAIATAALDVQWPFVGALYGGVQRVTPRVQIVATPPVENMAIPNEDSRAFDLEDTNIFSLNRFPGYDRYEENARVTYGVEWAYDRPSLSINAFVAQSYRLDDSPVLFPDGTGLADRFSDVVGRLRAAYRDKLRLTYRFRLDKDDLAVRRNEVDLTVGSRRTYATIGYLRLNRDIDQFAEDLADREEIRAGGRIAFARYWSVFGSAIVDLTGPRDDPASQSDGFAPVRHRLGVAYEDECVTFGLTWRRDYENVGDAQRGNSFLLRLAFRNLGV